MSKQALFRSYAVGVLQSAQFMVRGHGEDGMAHEIIEQLLNGERLEWLQRLCRHEGVTFPSGFWSEHARRARLKEQHVASIASGRVLGGWS